MGTACFLSGFESRAARGSGAWKWESISTDSVYCMLDALSSQGLVLTRLTSSFQSPRSMCCSIPFWARDVPSSTALRSQTRRYNYWSAWHRPIIYPPGVTGNKIIKFNSPSHLYVRLRKAIDDTSPHKAWDIKIPNSSLKDTYLLYIPLSIFDQQFE